jgi:hypothetical protein
VKAWLFGNANRRLNYGDNRKIVIGETHTISTDKKKLKLCKWGLHACVRIIDALDYAHGPMIYRVTLSGEIIESNDKIVATERTYDWGVDATDLLREFAYAAVKDGAWYAARDPAWYECWYAASAAAWDAASAAASAAALAEDSDAASAAIWDAAWNAARDAQNQLLEDMVYDAFRGKS